jgi:hypothetical protein
MTFEEFRDSLQQDDPPKGLSLSLTALWWDGKGDWTKAYESAQRDEGPAGAWVHAHLHRKEGDLSNAAYWYKRAGNIPSRKSLTEEWNRLRVRCSGDCERLIRHGSRLAELRPKSEQIEVLLSR